MTYRTPLSGNVSGDPQNNSVTKIQGITISGTPVAGQVIAANSSSTASWQDVGAGTIVLAGDVTGAGNANLVSDVQGQSVVSGVATVFNVKVYGALGNNSHDDTVAIQNAINAANAIGGGIVKFPAGTYKITSNLLQKAGCLWQGDGVDSTIIQQHTATNKIVYAADADDSLIQDISLVSAGNAHGVHVQSIGHSNSHPCCLNRCSVTGFTGTTQQITVNISDGYVLRTSHGYSNGTVVQFSAIVGIPPYPFQQPAFSATGNIITLASHGLTNHDPVAFNDIFGAGLLPSPVVRQTTYYANVIDANTFHISATSGGSNISFTGTGAVIANLVALGVVPAPLSPLYEYYVVNASTNQFQVSATAGGSPIAITAIPSTQCYVAQVFGGVVYETNGGDMQSPRVMDTYIDGGQNYTSANHGIIVGTTGAGGVVVHATTINGELGDLKRGFSTRSGEMFAVNTHIYNIADGALGGICCYANSDTGIHAINLRFEGEACERAAVFDTGSFDCYVTGPAEFDVSYTVIDSVGASSWWLTNSSGLTQFNNQQGMFSAIGYRASSGLYSNHLYANSGTGTVYFPNGGIGIATTNTVPDGYIALPLLGAITYSYTSAPTLNLNLISADPSGFNRIKIGDTGTQFVSCAPQLLCNEGIVISGLVANNFFTVTTSSYTCDSGSISDNLVFVNFAGTVSIVLPTANTFGGGNVICRQLTVKDTSGAAGTNPITITVTGGQTIEGNSSVTINTNWGSYTFVAHSNSDWGII